MRIPIVVLIGSVLGVLGAAGIYFEPREPYKHHIVAAGTLRGLLVALLTGFSMSAESGWLAGLGLGAVYGAAFGLVIYLAKGGAASGDAPFVIPVSLSVDRELISTADVFPHFRHRRAPCRVAVNHLPRSKRMEATSTNPPGSTRCRSR